MDPRIQQHIAQEQSEQRQREIAAAKERIARGEKPWEGSSGILSVVDAVRDVRFPASVEDLAQQAGDRVVVVSDAARVPLARVLGKLKDDRHFPTIKDFHTAVQVHWEGIRNLGIPPEQWPGPRGGGPPGASPPRGAA